MEPTWQQQDLLDLVQLEADLPIERRKKRIAVASGQGPGKTRISCVVAAWRCIRYPNALCIVTAPSMRQCKQWIDEFKRLLLRAHPVIRKFFEAFDTLIRIAKTKIWGIKTATATRPENLQGIHERRLTFIADEASGVSRKIMETIKGTLSNPDALFLQIGNPNTMDCDFYDSFTQFRDQWHTLRWNAEETARDYPHIVSPARNKALADEYGIDSDVYRIRVKGEFPRQDPNSVMSIDDLVHCTRTSMTGCAAIKGILPINRAIGLDFARYGQDESVYVRRVGLAVVSLKYFVKTDPTEVVDYAFAQQYDAHWKDSDCWYIPDAGGMGQGVMHSFHESGKNVYEFHTQGRPFDGTMFADQMTEAWWNFRGLVREHICRIPNDPRLLKQLSTRQYYTDRKGKLKLETKDEWRERMEIDESPDRADAVVQAFYGHVGAEARVTQKAGKGYMVGSKIRRAR
jgi:type III restriction/modification enzyme restriction subunit